MKWFINSSKKFIFLIPLITLFCCYSNNTSAQTNKIYSLFVYNFTKYLEWPSTNDDFTITVFGNSKVFEELQIMVQKKSINGHPILLKRTDNLDEINNCDLIYISSNKSRLIKEILIKIKDKAILLVGEQEGLARKGSGISLFLNEDDNVKFEINKKAIENQQLKVSSALIKLAIP